MADNQPYVNHEAHGHCRHCHSAAHRYPYGWDHVGCGMHACPNLDPVCTCCAAHMADTAAGVPSDRR